MERRCCETHYFPILPDVRCISINLIATKNWICTNNWCCVSLVWVMKSVNYWLARVTVMKFIIYLSKWFLEYSVLMRLSAYQQRGNFRSCCYFSRAMSFVLIFHIIWWHLPAFQNIKYLYPIRMALHASCEKWPQTLPMSGNIDPY